jgi:hypothetical protein
MIEVVFSIPAPRGINAMFNGTILEIAPGPFTTGDPALVAFLQNYPNVAVQCITGIDGQLQTETDDLNDLDARLGDLSAKHESLAAQVAALDPSTADTDALTAITKRLAAIEQVLAMAKVDVGAAGATLKKGKSA